MTLKRIEESNILSLPSQGKVRSIVDASGVTGCGAVLQSREEGSALHNIGPAFIVG